ncbi:MAG: hypothetical protein IAF02_26030 [Anaerolineae bacterium]|nr:hypothetical protein [Anaerolineae bacterium]
MARELGVAYVYRDPPATPVQPEEPELSTKMLANLSPELLQALRQATLVADREAILTVIERIERQAPETGASLRTLVDNFQIDRIWNRLNEIDHKENDD